MHPSTAELGAILALFDSGQHNELEGRALSLTTRYPNSVLVWKIYGTSLLIQGKDLLPTLQKIADLLPDDADAQADLGNAWLASGKTAEALASYHKALAIKPDSAEIHYNLGNALRGAARFAEARDCFLQAIRLKPDYAEAHNNLGNALSDIRQFEAAAASYRNALKIKPDYAEAHYNLGNAMRDCDQLQEAMACYGRALEINPAYAEAHSNLGNSLRAAGRLEEAMACYCRALDINPDFAEAYLNQANVLMVLGKQEEAEKSLNKAIELKPYDAYILSALIALFPYRKRDPRFKRLRKAYAWRESLPMNQRVKLNFAMGKAMESIGRYDEAFSAYEEGNRLHYRRHPFDEAADELVTEQLCSFFSPEIFQIAADVANEMPPVLRDRVPIFIVGMPRSGTTLIEQILASHPAVHGAGELKLLDEIFKNPANFTPPFRENKDLLLTLRRLGQLYLDQVWRIAPESRYITDKMPDNFRYLGLIRLMLPQAKIIHAVRDPLDTCLSCFTMNFSDGHEYSYNLETLGRRFLRYEQLMHYWHNVLPWDWLLDIQYETNITSPDHETRRMLDFIGLPWHPACLKFYESDRAVHSASVAQVRQPLYTGSIARWKRFEPHLRPLLEVLRPKPEHR